MSASEALELFAILTVGDGLVSQIPALFIAITAGIIVTRVSHEDSSDLGSDIGGQVIAQPRALLIGGVLLVLFALIPGFPKSLFWSWPPWLVVVVSSFSINRKNKLNQIAPTYQALFRKGPVRQQRSQTNPLHLETVKAN